MNREPGALERMVNFKLAPTHLHGLPLGLVQSTRSVRIRSIMLDWLAKHTFIAPPTFNFD